MRNFLILCLLSISTLSYSQKEIAWFDAALKVMYGNSNIINMAAIDDSNLNYELAFGNAVSFGGKVGINKGYNGLAIELMYAKNGTTYEGLNGYPEAPEIKWNSMDLYFLFRNAKNLGFFEIGPKIGFLKGVERTGADGQLADFTEFNSRQISGVLGFGVNVLGTDGSFSGQIGLRLEYGFTDINGQDDPAAGNEPFPYATGVYSGDKGYQKSAPIFAGLVFELNWGIGAYGIAKCGARAKFFSL